MIIHACLCDSFSIYYFIYLHLLIFKYSSYFDHLFFYLHGLQFIYLFITCILSYCEYYIIKTPLNFFQREIKNLDFWLRYVQNPLWYDKFNAFSRNLLNCFKIYHFLNFLEFNCFFCFYIFLFVLPCIYQLEQKYMYIMKK